MKAGHKRRREAGLYHGGPAPYGTEYRDGKQVLVKSQAPIVKRMFKEYGNGKSQQAITRRLVADGVPTSRGGKWHQGTVRAILANDVYVKLGMVDAKTWAKVEALRKSKARRIPGGRPPKGRHLFRKGMLKCECGGSMVPQTKPNRREDSEPYEVYVCSGRQREPDSCSMPALRRVEVDTAVFDFFSQVALDVEATKAQLAESHDHELGRVRALREQADGEVARLEGEAAHVEGEFRKGWTGERFKKVIANVESELAAARAEAERLAASQAEVEGDDGFADVEQVVLERLTEIRRAMAGEIRDAADADALRAALRRLFREFVISVPRDGESTIWPKWRAECVEGGLLDVKDFTEDGEPIFELSPSQVPLEISKSVALPM